MSFGPKEIVRAPRGKRRQISARRKKDLASESPSFWQNDTFNGHDVETPADAEEDGVRALHRGAAARPSRPQALPSTRTRAVTKKKQQERDRPEPRSQLERHRLRLRQWVRRHEDCAHTGGHARACTLASVPPSDCNDRIIPRRHWQPRGDQSRLGGLAAYSAPGPTCIKKATTPEHSQSHEATAKQLSRLPSPEELLQQYRSLDRLDTLLCAKLNLPRSSSALDYRGHRELPRPAHRRHPHRNTSRQPEQPQNPAGRRAPGNAQPTLKDAAHNCATGTSSRPSSGPTRRRNGSSNSWRPKREVQPHCDRHRRRN